LAFIAVENIVVAGSIGITAKLYVATEVTFYQFHWRIKIESVS